MQTRGATLISFISGFTALGYEILWARRLSDIIGATALASSLVVGVFFLALAAGAIVLGPRASRHSSPWRFYGVLEVGVLVAILPAFFGEEFSGILTRTFGELLLQPAAKFVMKAGLALVFVAPASFLMGGTLPAMGQAVVQAKRLGREGNTLYGYNTLGGATGIVITTFVLLPIMGMQGSFLVLMLGSLVLASAAQQMAKFSTFEQTNVGVHASRKRTQTQHPATSPHGSGKKKRTISGIPADPGTTPVPELSWDVLAFISGFTILGLEILALHLFSQVLHNSSYTFASVLIVVIAALSVGALVTQHWQLDAARAWTRLGIVLLLGTVATALLPRLFLSMTGGMSPFGGGVDGLAVYVMRILGVGGAVLGPPFIFLGWVFPLVLAGAGDKEKVIGKRWGRLLGINAAGALLGLMLANHVALPRLGLWLSFTAWCIVLLATAVYIAWQSPRSSRPVLWSFTAIALLAVVVGYPGSFPIANLRSGETIVAWRAGAEGVAAVVDRPQLPERRIKWNNTYSLGGSGNAAQQARLGHIPLLLHPQPRNVGFIGLATGITASSALRDPAAPALTAVELSGQITTLACEYFSRFNRNVCASPRARVVVEDGRLFFRATREQYDVVVGDLFVPWRSGVANLFTREHFETVHKRLREGGIFAQWLPLFQLDSKGFWGIARTFCEVFPNAWLAIADFQPHNAAVALIGWRDTDGGPSSEVMQERCAQYARQKDLREPMLSELAGAGMFLVGPVAPSLPADIPLMTMDRPWLADHAPHVERTSPSTVLLGAPLIAQLQRIASQVPDSPLREHIRRGLVVYEFTERYNRAGAESAAAWFETHLQSPLPNSIFNIAQPERMNWPFSEAIGKFLIRYARAQSP